MSGPDPAIQLIFGPPPAGIDLTDSLTVAYDVVSCVVLGIAAASVGLRFYVRTMRGTNNLAIDDYFVVLGLFCTGALVATTLIAGAFDAGKHVWSTTLPRLMTLLKVVFAEPWVYAASVTSTKISVLLLYRRLFYTGDGDMLVINRIFTMMYWGATFFTCVYPLIMWIVMAVACRPLNFFWTQYAGATEGKCINYLQFFLIFGIVNMVNDVIILLVPIPRILKLHMNKRKKVSVAGIMLLGSFVCVASIVRIYYLTKLTTAIDITYILGPAFGWSSLEPSVAIIGACLPTFAPLFRGIRNKGSNSSGKGSHLVNLSATPNFLKQQSHFRIEESDEVELTNKSYFQGESRDGEGSVGSEDVERDIRGITVTSQVQVVSDRR
ncbi:integral membrane protein [Rutstroemia sp. NJR-2017a WRK4]|nr:integral membrane protein [Rutstroemia sp. NJR-2017a WRK4]